MNNKQMPFQNGQYWLTDHLPKATVMQPEHQHYLNLFVMKILLDN